MVKKIVSSLSVVVGITFFAFTYQKHEALPKPHPPHSKIQYNVESFLAQQHGPNVECKRRCAPEGFEDEVGEGTDLEVVTCAGHGDDSKSCAKLGSLCGEEHKVGCAEWCRDQCCSCCSI